MSLSFAVWQPSWSRLVWINHHDGKQIKTHIKLNIKEKISFEMVYKMQIHIHIHIIYSKISACKMLINITDTILGRKFHQTNHNLFPIGLCVSPYSQIQHNQLSQLPVTLIMGLVYSRSRNYSVAVIRKVIKLEKHSLIGLLYLLISSFSFQCDYIPLCWLSVKHYSYLTTNQIFNIFTDIWCCWIWCYIYH